MTSHAYIEFQVKLHSPTCAWSSAARAATSAERIPSMNFIVSRLSPVASFAILSILFEHFSILASSAAIQGLTLVHLSAQRKHILWDTFGE